MKRIAVVISGHARMVPQGYHMLKTVLDEIPECEYEIFSLTWSNGDAQEQKFPCQMEESSRILQGLGDRYLCLEQEQVLPALYEKFINAGAIPGPDDPILPFETFSRYTGQIWGFLYALDHWRDRLGTFDVLIRSRWDKVLDRSSIAPFLDQCSFRTDPSPNSWLITTDVSINRGQIYYSGDTIYGTAKRWMEIIPSGEIATQRSINAVKRWYHANVNDRSSVIYDIPHKWFTSHWLWSTLFDGIDISVASHGHSLAIKPHHAKLRLSDLNEHVIAMNPIPID